MPQVSGLPGIPGDQTTTGQGPLSVSSASQTTQPSGGLSFMSGENFALLDPTTQGQMQRADTTLKALWANSHPGQTPDYSSPEYQSFARNNLASSSFQNLISGSEAENQRLDPIKQQLSDLLSQNKFAEAIKVAQDNNAQGLLEDPNQLATLRAPFTKDEAAQFLNAVPDSWLKNSPFMAGTSGSKYDPNLALQNSLSANNWGNSATGYPALTTGVWTPETTAEKLFKTAVELPIATAIAAGTAGLAGYGPLAGEAGGLGTAAGGARRAAHPRQDRGDGVRARQDEADQEQPGLL